VPPGRRDVQNGDAGEKAVRVGELGVRGDQVFQLDVELVRDRPHVVAGLDEVLEGGGLN
jgi:hypothetical protein